MRRADRYGDEVYRILADIIYKKNQRSAYFGDRFLDGVRLVNESDNGKSVSTVGVQDLTKTRKGGEKHFEKAAGFLQQRATPPECAPKKCRV